MLRHWLITFFGNLAGALFVVAIIIGYSGVLSDTAYRNEVFAIATTKAVHPQWHQIFLKAIGANWLVCLACFLSCCAREFFSKVTAIWWPVFAFVLLGLDHVVANMFYIPLAVSFFPLCFVHFLAASGADKKTKILLHHPDLTVGCYIWKSMIPAALGNIVGGSVFVAVVYWYLYLVGTEGPVCIDGDGFDLRGEMPESDNEAAIAESQAQKSKVNEAEMV